MHNTWRIGGSGKKHEEGVDARHRGRETQLVNAGQGNFTGKCYSCGKHAGHMSAQCPEKNQSQGECEECGKVGHVKKDCWDNPENADKIPEWLKKKRAREAKGEPSGACVEIMMASVEVPELKWAGEEVLLADEFKLNDVIVNADSFSSDSGGLVVLSSANASFVNEAHSLSGSVAREAHSLSGTAMKSGTSEEQSVANSFGIDNVVSVVSFDKALCESASSGADATGSSKYESVSSTENVERRRVSERVVLGAQPSQFEVESFEKFASASKSTSEFGRVIM
jgi:hypothetical protein